MNELRRWAVEASTYSAITISFDGPSKQIRDSAGGLKRFVTGQRIQVAGSASNNGYYTIATGGLTSPITVNESVTTEAAGATDVISDVTDPIDDDDLARAINTASRDIDHFCKRRFWVNSVDEVRYYDTEFEDLLFTDDIQSVTSLLADQNGDGVYEITWATTDYLLLPRNAMLEDCTAYRRIGRAPMGAYYFPTKTRPYYSISGGYRYAETLTPTEYGAIQLTGKFGWVNLDGSVPDGVHQACLIHAHELFKAKDSPGGIAGQTEYGVIRVKDALDVRAKMLLESYVRLGG